MMLNKGPTSKSSAFDNEFSVDDVGALADRSTPPFASKASSWAMANVVSCVKDPGRDSSATSALLFRYLRYLAYGGFIQIRIADLGPRSARSVSDGRFRNVGYEEV
jgi:hypothetical protein